MCFEPILTITTYYVQQNGFEMFDNILRRSRAMPLSLTITDIDAVHANDVLKRLEEVCHRVNRLVVGRHVGLPMASVLQITREDLVLIITKIPDHKQFNLSATPRALHLPYGLNNLYPLIRTSLLRQVRLETVFMSELSKILGHAPNLVSCVIEILAVPANAHLTLLRNNCLEELCLSCLAPVGNAVAVDFSGLTRLRRLKLDMVFRGSSGAVHFSPYSGPHLEEVHVGYRVHELDTALSTSLRLRHLVLCYQSLLEDYTTPPLPDFFQSLERITICGQGDIQPLLSLLPCLTIDHLPQP